MTLNGNWNKKWVLYNWIVYSLKNKQITQHHLEYLDPNSGSILILSTESSVRLRGLEVLVLQ